MTSLSLSAPAATPRAAGLRLAAILAEALASYDAVTGCHSYAVGALSARIAACASLDAEQVGLVGVAGELHDVGKLAVPRGLLNKADPLAEEERLVLERHPVLGFRMLEALGLQRLATWVLHHHERWDGSGYPHGLAGDEIPLEARIVLVADAYDAMTSDRAYRPALSHERALVELEQGAGSQFDPGVVAAFSDVARPRLVAASSRA